MASKRVPQEAKDLHNKLVTDLHDHINAKVDEHDFEKLKYRLKLKLTPMDLKTCKNIMELTDKLQKRGHVEPGKYEEFVKLIECIDKTWVDFIREEGEKISEIIDKANAPQGSPPKEESEKSKKRKLEEENNANKDLAQCKDGFHPQQQHSSEKRKQKSVYRRDGNQKGLALILNFTKDRQGTEADFKNIKDFFESTLNFECHVEEDPKSQEVHNFLQETAGLFNNKRKAEEYYCLLVFIMSHGNEDGIYTDDGKTISLDEIVSYFKNDKLKYFAGKPKCFFIQACRGSSPQGAVDLPDDKKEVMLEEVVGKISIPTDADLLLTYATTPGYYAYRRPFIGSWFFHNLIDVLKQHYKDEHLEDMLIDVKEILAYDEEWQTNEGYKQMPCTWSTLTKRFFLAP